MTMIRTAAPTVLAVSVQAAKQALRIDGDDMDALITIWTKGVIAELEHQTGQCMMEQTWEVRLPSFPGAEMSLPHPAMGITSVTYVDEAGDSQTMAPEQYRLNRGRYASALSPARDASWPATAEDDSAVVVTLQAGYGADPAATPDNVQLYILAKLVEQFDPITRLERDTVQSAFVDRLLDACRSYS